VISPTKPGAVGLVLLLACSLLARPGWAQSPIGSDFRVNELVPGHPDHFAGRLVPLSDGSWRTAWIESPSPLDTEPPYSEFLLSRSVDARGALGPVQRFAQGEVADTGLGDLFLTQASGFHFALFFGQSGNPAALRGIVFDSSGHRLEAFRRSDIGGLWAVVPRRGGLWTALGASEDIPLFWEVLDASGNQIHGPTAITPRSQPVTCGYGFAATLDGDGAVAWSVDANPVRHTGDVRARFFTSTGELGREFQVNPRPGTSICPEIAMLPGGREAWVLYRDAESFFPPSDDLHVQRVAFSGQRMGPEITVSAGPDAARLDRKIASDRFGNFVVAWSQLAFAPDNCGITGRLYRADGRPVGGPFPFSTNPDQCGREQQVDFADNGTLAAIWQVPHGDDPSKQDVYFARFSASPADEPCLVRAGHLLCDTGRTGGLPELDLEVSADPAATLLMGDVDGDGRADPCVVEGSRLRCDLDHRGAPFEWERDFPPGWPDGTGTPLLGDVDGNGKAGLCLWRQGTLRCRTPSGLFQERFGEAGDVPLLGDVDGDGRADLCVRRGNQFLCDTAHDGGGAELKITFGLPTDLPLLGDFDGDGRADPCLLRGHLLLCDTKHNGGIAEGKLVLATQPGDRLLLGNLDGL
jgi:hypothetical protein